MRKSPSEMIFRDFLIKSPPEKLKKLARFLSEGEKARLNELPDLAKLISFEEFQEDVLLDWVHWSWLIPILKTYAPKEQKYFVTALSEASADPLKKALEL